MEWIGILGALVPIAFFAAAVLIIWFAIQAGMRRHRWEHDERMLAIEKGVDIPMTPRHTRKQHNPYVWGFVLIGIGLAMLIAMGVEGDNDWGWSFLPMFIGIAMLVAHTYHRKQLGKSGPTAEEPAAGEITAGTDSPPESET